MPTERPTESPTREELRLSLMKKAIENNPECYDSLGIPIFRHDHHKAIWGYIADNPGANKKDAIEALGLEDTKYPSRCAACSAKQSLLKVNPEAFMALLNEVSDRHEDDEEEEVMGVDLSIDMTGEGCRKFCPLDWSEYDVCTAAYDSLFDDWADMQRAYEAHVVGLSEKYIHRQMALDKMLAVLKEYATIIRDLPLNKNARDYYHIVG